jgi:hypothetical protein
MSAFKSGETVRNIVPVEGIVMEYRPQDNPIEPTVGEGISGPTPDTEIGAIVKIKAGQKGSVMYSDDIRTIVTYDFNTTGELQPHVVKAEGFTTDFERVVRGNRPSRGPNYYPDRKAPKDNPTQMESKWKKRTWKVIK